MPQMEPEEKLSPILNYLSRLINACKTEEDFSLIWDVYWDKLNKLHHLGLTPTYYCDGSRRDDILVSFEAYKTAYLKNPDLYELLAMGKTDA